MKRVPATPRQAYTIMISQSVSKGTYLDNWTLGTEECTDTSRAIGCQAQVGMTLKEIKCRHGPCLEYCHKEVRIFMNSLLTSFSYWVRWVCGAARWSFHLLQRYDKRTLTVVSWPVRKSYYQGKKYILVETSKSTYCLPWQLSHTKRKQKQNKNQINLWHPRANGRA